MANLGSDPGFQSFLRTLESRRSEVETERNRRIASLLAQHQLDLAEIGISEERGLENVNLDFEDRGMFRSGGRLEDRADVVQDANTQRGRAEFMLAENQSLANRTAAGELGNLSIMRSQEEMAARQRIADREFAQAAQARAERLAAEERSRWEAEQQRLQALYDQQAGILAAATAQPATRTVTAAPTTRTINTAPVTRALNSVSRAPSSTNPVRVGSNRVVF